MQEVTADHPRIFVSGSCAHCGDWYLRIGEPGVTWAAGSGYCCEGHRKRAQKIRTKKRSDVCPVRVCERDIRRPGAVVCGVCWSAMASMCLGKRRLTERQAREVEQRCGLAARWCRCCGWWHNVGHLADDGDALVLRVGNVLTALAAARGQLWVNDLVESWDPEHRDRREWSEKRTARRLEQGRA